MEITHVLPNVFEDGYIRILNLHRALDVLDYVFPIDKDCWSDNDLRVRELSFVEDITDELGKEGADASSVFLCSDSRGGHFVHFRVVSYEVVEDEFGPIGAFATIEII